MATSRRIGSKEAESRLRLLDAAIELMRREGHTAVTVRRISEEAGLKRQLVHYYFHSMEDLFVEIVRRVSERYLERQARALASPNPARAIWELASNPQAARLEIELMAVGNRLESVRKLMADYSERARQLQVDAIRSALEGGKVVCPFERPEAVVVFLRGIAKLIVMETNTGISSGHAEMIAEVEDFLRGFDAAERR
ncbi:MAG: TetR/AcrR family transcriptional regulator [Novosphingobium sp.]|nr:TetR/AcrR family transcriptional regulator [Novosphingobium sp.]MCP5404035.1 TetR/AcrR family transcriptional regulator [Novosphingobium sp.]